MPPLASTWPSLLSDRFSLRQLVSSMSLPSFLRSVPISRHRPLLGRVPSGRFPHVVALTAALRLLVCPAVLVSLARPFRRSQPELTRPPRFLGNPYMRAAF